MKTLGMRLRSARERKKISQVEVFKKTGINNKTLSRYENDGTEPDSDSLRRLSDLYEVTVDWLVTGKEKENDYPLSNSQFDWIVKEAEEKYGVTLRGDPVVEGAFRDLVYRFAEMKKKQ